MELELTQPQSEAYVTRALGHHQGFLEICIFIPGVPSKQNALGEVNNVALNKGRTTKFEVRVCFDPLT